MKKLIYIILALTLATSIGLNVHAYTRTKGYTKKNGTYVAPHYQTKSDKSKMNNWSTKGNKNPITGEKGYKRPFKQNNSGLKIKN